MDIMKQRLLILVAAAACAALWSAVAFAGDQCLTCHEALDDAQSKLFKSDIHFRKGLSCADCHGGNRKSEDMEAAMSKKAGFIGVPKGDERSKLCADCHSQAQTMRKFDSDLPTDQWEDLQASVHGKLSTSGREHIVQCTTCHNAHGIVSVKSPASPVYPLNVVKICSNCHSNAALMRSYNPSLPIDQLDKYRASVHGIRNAKGDAKTAECASCHGSHDILPVSDVRSKVYATRLPETCAECHADPAYIRGYGIPSDQYQKFSKSVHGIALLQKGDLGAPSCNDCHGNHGAVPPGVESISKVCGICHALNASLFASSPHKVAFDRKKLPECETCHGHHDIAAATDDLVGVSSTSACAWCHKPDTPNRGRAVAITMRALTDSLNAFERKSQSLIEEAEQKGMEVGEAKFKLRSVRQARLESRTMVHSFNEEKFREVMSKGITTANVVSNEANAAIEEYYFRRKGMGISTFIMTILGISLYLTIRRIERRQSERK